jgi:hypothetical protein
MLKKPITNGDKYCILYKYFLQISSFLLILKVFGSWSWGFFENTVSVILRTLTT